MKPEDLPPLPADLEREIQSFRQVKPAQAFVDRAFSSLPDRPATAELHAKPSRANRNAGPFLIKLAPVMAIAAIAGYLFMGRGDPMHDPGVVRVEERTLSLPEAGHAWTELDLQTQHHDDLPAVVHLDAPNHVKVELVSNPGATVDKQCKGTRCVHKFTHRHGDGSPVRVALTHPGRYEIHVRHESKKAALRERFVLTANRD